MPVAVLAAAFLFNLGQGALRPSLPLYLQRSFAANYRMVTLIPVVFGAGKWIASVPTGYLLGRLGRPLMIWGLLLIALIDLASVMTSTYTVFLGLRALGGVGWAMFATVATTAMVNVSTVERRGRAVSLLLMSETAGLLLGSAAGGWLYQGLGAASPFVFEAACVFAAAVAVGRWASLGARRAPVPRGSRDWRLLTAILRRPGVLLMGAINATLIAIQTGVLVFLFPLYLASRGGVGPEAIGLLISLSVLGRLLALWLGGTVSDRWGRMRVLIPGLLSYAVLLGTVTCLTQPMVLGVWSLAIGAAAGFVAAIPTAVIGDQVPPPLQGVAIGWLRMMTDSGQILGPLVMGALADGVDLSAPFLFGAALLTATAWQCRRQANAISVAVTTERRDA
ncbi:MAG: MFS transporter [Candidatus Rokubacteria bacterium]|nr:MFS transporter [Candidatus Rokubacteria bacterium]